MLAIVLLRWDETVSLCGTAAANGPIIDLSDDTRVNVE
jgi:hypothetical protein